MPHKSPGHLKESKSNFNNLLLIAQYRFIGYYLRQQSPGLNGNGFSQFNGGHSMLKQSNSPY